MDPVYHTVIAPLTPTVYSNTFLDYIQQLLPWEQTYLANIKYLPTMDQVIGYFQEGFLLYATDGSAKDNIGSNSMILSTKDGKRIVTNTGEMYSPRSLFISF